MNAINKATVNNDNFSYGKVGRALTKGVTMRAIFSNPAG